MLCLKTAICVETMSMKFHVLGVPSAKTLSEPNHIFSLIIRWMVSVDRFDWSIARSRGGGVDARIFFSVFYSVLHWLPRDFW